jgi:conjugal transfer pilus assembly protein TraF
MDKIKSNSLGLWFFFASYCQYCEKMIPVMKRFKEDYGMDILAISLDGKLMEGLEDFKVVVDINNEVANRFNVTLTPTTYLVLNNNEAKLVVEGLKSLPELENKILRTARMNNLISDEMYSRTRTVYEENLFANKNGTLFVDRNMLNSDPNYLSEALKNQLENVKPFGTTLINKPQDK